MGVLGGGGGMDCLGSINLVMSVIPLETEMRIENNIKKNETILIQYCIFTDNSGHFLFLLQYPPPLSLPWGGGEGGGGGKYHFF